MPCAWPWICSRSSASDTEAAASSLKPSTSLSMDGLIDFEPEQLDRIAGEDALALGRRQPVDGIDVILDIVVGAAVGTARHAHAGAFGAEQAAVGAHHLDQALDAFLGIEAGVEIHLLQIAVEGGVDLDAGRLAALEIGLGRGLEAAELIGNGAAAMRAQHLQIGEL